MHDPYKQYALWLQHNEHFLTPSLRVVETAAEQAKLTGTQMEALLIFTTTDMLAKAGQPGEYNPYLNYCINLWVQAKA